jgi:hypothetical protein
MFRRFLCAGSHAAEEQFPEETDSEYSEEGTLLHDHCANPDNDRAGLTGEQREILERAERCVDQIFKSVKSSLKISDNEAFEEGHEKEMWFRKGLKNLFPGHCDRWRYYPRIKVLVIIDHKFGYRKVEPAETNTQLRCYAVMGAAKWDSDHVLVAIDQPRLGMDERVSISEYDREAIKAAREYLLEGWDDCHQPNAPRVADAENQCLYCKAKLHCDAYREKYAWMSGIPTDQAGLFIDRLAELTDEQFAKVFEACSFAEKVFDKLKEEGRRRKESGRLPMFEVGKETPDARITDPYQAFQLMQKDGLSNQEILSCASFGLGNLAEKVSLRFTLSNKDAKRRVRDVLNEVITVTAKAAPLKLIPDWKPQPAAIENGSDAELFPK